VHRGGANNDWRFVEGFQLFLGGGQGSGEQTDWENRLEQDPVHYTEERSQRGLPAVKRLRHVSRKHESVPTGALNCTCAGIPWAGPTSGNTYAGFYSRHGLKRGPVEDRWKLLTPASG
jgi:hypothetical protein